MAMYIALNIYTRFYETFIFVAIKCPVPKSIPIGSVRYTGLTFNSLAIYSCPAKYILAGFQQRQCRSDGTWTGTPPQCKDLSSGK